MNCEKCIDNYYRPYGVSANSKNPCVPCNCSVIGSEQPCNPMGGECTCKHGFTGTKCDQCDIGHKGDMCRRCECDASGTMPGGQCESHCQCKVSSHLFFCAD